MAHARQVCPLLPYLQMIWRNSSHRMQLLASYNEEARRNGETSIDGLPSSRLRSCVYTITFVPARCDYREWHETGASTRVTFLYVDPALFRKSNDCEGAFLPSIYLEGSLVWQTVSKLKNTIESGRAEWRPYLEALSAVRAHELSRVNQDVVDEPAVCRGGSPAGKNALSSTTLKSISKFSAGLGECRYAGTRRADRTSQLS
jgi:hypothetical protein